MPWFCIFFVSLFCLTPVCVSLLQYLTATIWIQFFLLVYFFCLVCKCLSVPSTRRPHHPASIHHSPPTSHPTRPYWSIRHPRLRPHSHWQQRYSTTPRISTTPSACYILILLLLFMSYSSVLLLHFLKLQHPYLIWTHWGLKILRMGKNIHNNALLSLTKFFCLSSDTAFCFHIKGII